MAAAPAFERGARVAVLGLGVSGEAAARLAHARGGVVYASDVSDGRAQRTAAARLQSEGIEAEAGQHDLDRILACEVVVTSPGISPFSEVRRRINEAGVRTIAEIELACRDLRSQAIAITGTNGKTTTTHLTAHLLTASGIEAQAVGNVGQALSTLILGETQPDWVAVELSSFQLADLETFTPQIGVLLNLAPDHLDRYRDEESYYADKRRLFDNAHEGSRWILNADDEAVLALAAEAEGERYLFSVCEEVEQGAFLTADRALAARLPGRRESWIAASDLRLLGIDNVANSLAAGLAAALAGADRHGINRGLATFRSLPHRLEPVGERAGVLWINDSKATNIAATRSALRAFDRPVVLLLGGRHKGEPYSKLGTDLSGRVRAVVAFGEAAPRIVSDLHAAAAEIRVESGLDAVVRAAEQLARPGDVVLLSPACSSFDMFPNYEVRGEAFREAFRHLTDTEGSAA